MISDEERPKHWKKIGYARVSTDDQDPQLQIDALLKAGVLEEDIFVDKISGTITKRPEFDKCQRRLRKGDILYVYKLDRIAAQ